jgi:hypothetical protein
MQVYPGMNIRFPEGREAELVKGMKGRAQGPTCRSVTKQESTGDQLQAKDVR